MVIRTAMENAFYMAHFRDGAEHPFGAWFQWPTKWSMGLFALAAFLLIVAARRLPGRDVHLALASTWVPLAIVGCSSLLAFGAFRLLDMLNGTTVSWPAQLWPFRLVLFSTMLTAGALISSLVNRRIPVFVSLLGSWIFWGLLTLPLLMFVPDAANVLLIPLLPAAALLCLSSRILQDNGKQALLYVATLIFAAPMLAMAILLEATQGYGLVASTFAFIAPYAVAAGAFARGSWIKPLLGTGAALVIIGLVAASVLPLYSAWRPQHVNVDYIENADEQTAFWRLRSSAPPPERMLAQKDFSVPDRPLYPWTQAPSANLAHAARAALESPELTVLSIAPSAAGRRVRLRLHSKRSANFLQLALPAESTPVRYVVGDNERQPSPSTGAFDEGVTRLVFHGVQSRDVELSIEFQGDQPVTAYLLDKTTGVPAGGASLVGTRAPMGSPVHAGDMTLVYRKVVF